MKHLMALLAFLSLPLFGTTVTPMSIERLTQASSHVVVGQAGDTWSEWNAQHTQIFTYTRFKVSKSLKGDAPDTFVVKQMGGRAGAYEQKVAGVRLLREGDQAVLFVHPSQAADGTVVVTGLMQGSFRVVKSDAGETRVTNDVSGVDQFTPGQRVVGHFSGTEMPLDRFEALVRAAAKGNAK